MSKRIFCREIPGPFGGILSYNVVQLEDDGTTSNLLLFYKTVGGVMRYCKREGAEFLGVQKAID